MPVPSRRTPRILLHLRFDAFPVQASLGVLGRKWAFLVLLNIALSQAQRFNEMLRTTPGLNKRVLSMRLRELERQGFIARAEQTRGYTKWELTRKGVDVLPVLLTMIHFGAKWRPEGPSDGDPSREPGGQFAISYLPRARTPRAARTFSIVRRARSGPES